MSKVIQMKVYGIREVQQALKTKNQDLLNKADKGILQALQFLNREIVLSIAGQRAEKKSVDTGRFMSSIKYKKLGLLNGKVYSNVGYGPHLEYGTTNIKPRRHFRNSAARNRVKINEIIKRNMISK